MAYAALVSLEQTTDLILIHDKYSISVHEREQITSIREYVIFLIVFLENIPEEANRLEGKIRDLANEAEDLSEYFMLNKFQLNSWSVGLSRDAFEYQLDRVREEIGSITGDMMDDRLINLPAAVSSSRVADAGKNDVVVGLDGDLVAIKGRLCGESSKLEVIPMVGMGGIGKTTLARNAYDDPLTVEYFHIRTWVTVSEDYSVDEILSRLQKIIVPMKLLQEKELSMEEKVYRSLKGRRYLIVMDDIWSSKAWDDVRNIFPDDNNGSRIILTTRLSDVAAYASSGSPLHNMKFMDGDQSCNLLKQKVFTEGQDCPPELEDTGKEIAHGCRGLPLAVVLVAGILSTIPKTRASWMKIAKNVYSVVDGQLDKILSLSYTFLPHYLRPCFLFLGGFPEDHNIRVSRLVKLWVAEGFLRRPNEFKSLEEEAEEYVEDLVKRSLVLITRRKSNGKIKSCSLHDLVRDLCTRKAQEEKFLLSYNALPKRRIEERRISIGRCHLDEIQNPIRTILCFQAFLDSSSLAFLVSYRLLRVLDVINGVCESVPPQIFELFHLRYLALGFNNGIPAAISKLQNLQTLIIRPLWMGSVSYPTFTYLPLEIWSMPHLRHLVFTDWYMLPDPADGSTLPLEILQTLSDITNLVCCERILKMIPNLKKLGIIYYRNEEYHDLHNLVNLHHLEKLRITIPPSFTWQCQCPAFPRTLKKLILVGGRLPWKDMSIVGSLSNLEVLKLENHACDGDTWETTDGEFPQLKYLLIDKSNLQYWITENSHFPRLNQLMLNRCKFLKEIPDSIGEIPTLELITVDKSLMNSATQIQEDQRSYGNDALRVLRYFSDRYRPGFP